MQWWFCSEELIVGKNCPLPARMEPSRFRRKIKLLNPRTAKYRELEQALSEGTGFGSAWYRSQKEHWLGWLAEYEGSGAYGRKVTTGRDARFIYNHIQCAPMLFWLAEAVSIDDMVLTSSFEAVISAPKRNASQCAAFRKLVDWDMIEPQLKKLRLPVHFFAVC